MWLFTMKRLGKSSAVTKRYAFCNYSSHACFYVYYFCCCRIYNLCRLLIMEKEFMEGAFTCLAGLIVLGLSSLFSDIVYRSKLPSWFKNIILWLMDRWWTLAIPFAFILILFIFYKFGSTL